MHERATVVITTKNRKDDLARAVASAFEQTAQPRVLVIDDGSTDGTESFIKRRFPEVHLHRSDKSQGLIVQRNLAARLTESSFLFSIDDDAVFSSPDIVEATIEEFAHPRVGAVGIPFVDVNKSPEICQRAPDRREVYALYSYIGTAHALRRELFLGLSGYRGELCHQGEEEDYCIRMLDAGFVTRCGNSAPIHHFESPRRSFTRMDYYGARNKILFAWQNIPFPDAGWHLAATTIKTLLHAMRPDRFWIRLRGVAAAYALCLRGLTGRYPVTPETYRLSRRLKTQGPIPLNEIVEFLPQPALLASAN